MLTLLDRWHILGPMNLRKRIIQAILNAGVFHHIANLFHQGLPTLKRTLNPCQRSIRPGADARRGPHVPTGDPPSVTDPVRARAPRGDPLPLELTRRRAAPVQHARLSCEPCARADRDQVLQARIPLADEVDLLGQRPGEGAEAAGHEQHVERRCVDQAVRRQVKLLAAEGAARAVRRDGARGHGVAGPRDDAQGHGWVETPGEAVERLEGAGDVEDFELGVEEDAVGKGGRWVHGEGSGLRSAWKGGTCLRALMFELGKDSLGFHVLIKQCSCPIESARGISPLCGPLEKNVPYHTHQMRL